jgi:hypothetical protein
MFPSTIPPPVAFAPGITFNAKFPVPLLNVAEISWSAVIVNVHVAVVPGQTLLIPHPPNTDPAPGVSISVTCALLLKLTVHGPVMPCAVVVVQLMAPVLSFTVPYAVPSSTNCTLNVVAPPETVTNTPADVCPPNCAVIVAVPLPTAVASPVDPICTTPVFEEFHVASLVRS